MRNFLALSEGGLADRHRARHSRGGTLWLETVGAHRHLKSVDRFGFKVPADIDHSYAPRDLLDNLDVIGAPMRINPPTR